MFPSIDPKKMQSMMKQMGIAQEEIDAKRVIIESEDKNIIIENPSVIKIKMQGQETFQISGDIKEEENNSLEEDIKTIIEKTGCSEQEAKKALEDNNGDLAEAILSLS
ncbi:nascent polypeptide-associated complex protein [Candidatus Pacearchaeota archaeon]|nr:nascent polypeptide-associated complex protein [Candidatus Pacearchaeota archaeon]